MKTKYPIERIGENFENPSFIPSTIGSEIRKTVTEFTERFADLDETTASYKPSLQQWSRKEILGHLIDSAMNNQQRFVRAQYAQTTIFSSYEQQEWVRIQGYNNRSWKELIAFWSSLNLHVAHVIASIPPDCLRISSRSDQMSRSRSAILL